jgi:signal transduction histidine kinase
MSGVVELLSRPINFAVVQLPERNYPGVVVQGDSLNALVQRVERMSKLLEANQVEDLAAEIEDVHEQLSDALLHYESVCAERSIPLPYPKHK